MKYSQQTYKNSIEPRVNFFEPWISRDHNPGMALEQLATVKQLAGGVSHHFNNALQVIMTAAELAVQHPDIPNAVKDDILTLIIQQGHEAAELSRQLLDFSGEPVNDKQLVDLVSLTNETIETLKTSCPENMNLILTVDETKPNSYTIYADPAQIRQVIVNLTANAREAMPLGGVLHLRLSRFTRKRQRSNPKRQWNGPWIVLNVSDTGTGIPNEILSHIFEPFFTTKEIGQGSGLGLAQVYGIIKQHMGEIDVESQVGVGTTFSLYFPASRA